MSSSAPAAGRGASGGAASRPLYQRLYLQVLMAMAIGALLGWLYPDFATSLKPLSDGFIKAIRAIIQPIIFLTVVVGIATLGNLRQIARIGAKALIYFEAVSTLALLVGAFTRGDILPVLFLAVLFGLALCQLGERAKPLVNLLDIAVHGLFGVVRIIMYFAPLAALGAIAFT